eukprot:gnl/TRDRNA2_/TRDRNA2_60346_c0_seq1.p1 gnl/TRDRNA2_/TRDRNA2_60346_c0~~gnl/TRDRNA2_/TRDRNA2_60346_c0_seq1.p1  ORF type:complete len:164 (+),score=13.61 gnl/TRDRNA2_/TRDRNA2_60346_c0_seq1:63-494(+)
MAVPPCTGQTCPRCSRSLCGRHCTREDHARHRALRQLRAGTIAERMWLESFSPQEDVPTAPACGPYDGTSACPFARLDEVVPSKVPLAVDIDSEEPMAPKTYRAADIDSKKPVAPTAYNGRVSINGCFHIVSGADGVIVNFAH